MSTLLFFPLTAAAHNVNDDPALALQLSLNTRLRERLRIARNALEIVRDANIDIPAAALVAIENAIRLANEC